MTENTSHQPAHEPEPTMTRATFERRFTPWNNNATGENQWDDANEAAAYAPSQLHIWTVVRYADGSTVAKPGPHHLNRVTTLITAARWTDQSHVVAYDDAPAPKKPGDWKAGDCTGCGPDPDLFRPCPNGWLGSHAIVQDDEDDTEDDENDDESTGVRTVKATDHTLNRIEQALAQAQRDTAQPMADRAAFANVLTIVQGWREGIDTASSASRQHYIDTGRYLTDAEVAEDAGTRIATQDECDAAGIDVRRFDAEHGRPVWATDLPTTD
jgi:hypothetical protein